MWPKWNWFSYFISDIIKPLEILRLTLTLISFKSYSNMIDLPVGFEKDKFLFPSINIRYSDQPPLCTNNCASSTRASNVPVSVLMRVDESLVFDLPSIPQKNSSKRTHLMFISFKSKSVFWSKLFECTIAVYWFLDLDLDLTNCRTNWTMQEYFLNPMDLLIRDKKTKTISRTRCVRRI